MMLCQRSSPILPNKFQLRKKYRELRQEINESDREQCALSAASLLVQHPVFTASRHIACYYATGSEFETKPLINAIWQSGKLCYLPVMTDAKSLNFRPYNEGDELQLNQHAIPEPVSTLHFVHAEKLDLVLVPLLAFDDVGNRVGAGGGCYDRTFAFLYTQLHKTPFLLGVGYELQRSDQLHAEPWDIKLNGMLTEKKLTLF